MASDEIFCMVPVVTFAIWNSMDEKQCCIFMKETMACGFRLCRLNPLCSEYRKNYSVKIFSYKSICTENMNIKCRCDYFDVSYNRKTDKQTNRQTRKSNLTLYTGQQNNSRTHTHTHIGIINLALLFLVIFYIREEGSGSFSNMLSTEKIFFFVFQNLRFVPNVRT